MVAQPLRQPAPVDAPAPAQARLAVARPLLPPTSAILPHLKRIEEHRWYSNFGPLVGELEQRLAARGGPGAAVCTASSGTQALALLIQSVAKGAGLCLTPGFTFVATAHAARQAGLTPWFVDVDPESWMLTPELVREALARAPGPVAAIVVVAAFGALPDLHGFAALSAECGLPVVLDAAAAFDALAEPVLPSVVSLHATKTLSAGEGGYVIAKDPALIERIRSASSFGFAGSRLAVTAGTNAKLSEYAAAVGLAALDGWTAARQQWMLAARKLRLAAPATAGIAFQPGWGSRWISSTCVVRTGDGRAGEVAACLAAAGLDTRGWWGAGLHREPAFADCPHDRLETVERLATSTLGLPFAIDLDDEDIVRIGRALAGV